MNSCQCRFNCTTIAVIASVIIGVIAAFLTFTGMLAVGTPLLWAFLGIALGVLVITFVVAGLRRTDEQTNCLCPSLTALLTGVLGTILLTLVLLLIDIAVATVLGAILYGLLFLFFALIVTSVACAINCLADCR